MGLSRVAINILLTSYNSKKKEKKSEDDYNYKFLFISLHLIFTHSS